MTDEHDDFGGLGCDLRSMSRRGMFGLMAKAAAGFALVPIVGGCTSDGSATPDAATSACPAIPSETEGPYPGDGTNGPNLLAVSGVERRDIRTSIGTASGTADGLEFTITLTLVDSATCAPLVGHAVYLWHCDRIGDYSMYTGAAESENYLRGVQVTDGSGVVTFTTIFPGCYSGRWPHMHFEVYASLGAATTGAAKLAVSQLALPEATCDLIYATSGYEQSVTNLAGTSLASDGVFRDGSTLQVATVTGSIGANLTGALTIAITT